MVFLNRIYQIIALHLDKFLFLLLFSFHVNQYISLWYQKAYFTYTSYTQVADKYFDNNYCLLSYKGNTFKSVLTYYSSLGCFRILDGFFELGCDFYTNTPTDQKGGKARRWKFVVCICISVIGFICKYVDCHVVDVV